MMKAHKERQRVGIDLAGSAPFSCPLILRPGAIWSSGLGALVSVQLIITYLARERTFYQLLPQGDLFKK